MRLTDILQLGCIKVPLESKDKQSVITELVDMLDANGQLQDRDAALDSVLMREQTRSTGIGSGIAIPHGKCAAAKELVMAIGIAGELIDFASVDEKPVAIVLLLISPANKTGPHIQALAKISKLMLDEQFKQQLEQVTSADEAYKLLSDKEK